MSTGPDSALGLKWTNEDGAGGDEDGAAGSAVTDVTVAEEDGDVGMKDAAEDGDVSSTREKATFDVVGQKSWTHPRPSASR